jgi:hypothetical protein
MDVSPAVTKSSIISASSLVYGSTIVNEAVSDRMFFRRFRH